ncbi:uncharacterized protein L969DRAFT_58634 [Mixia osmundae IAM 14324]|nr:uncharacterized protein L969DRAFT_58634 [Mixia osmundae IAM 14324]KEI41517.1 hypothetical protein L969DRAFT_58634 [Mixia osmundae IAM 14324]
MSSSPRSGTPAASLLNGGAAGQLNGNSQASHRQSASFSRSSPAPPGLSHGNNKDDGPPSSNSLLTIVRAQIVFLLSTLTEDQYNKHQSEITSLVESHGVEANVYYIRRLISSSGPALAQLSSGAPAQPSQAQLTLRLLVFEIKRLVRQPALAVRFKDALQAGLQDTAAAAEVFRTLDLRGLVDRAGLTALERLILCAEVTQLIVMPRSIAKDLPIAAARLLREAWSPALETLAGQQTGPMPDLNPVAISRLFSLLLSDLAINPQTGEGGYSSNANRERIISDQQQRDLIQVFAARLGGLTELVVNILLHALETVEFDPQTSAITLLHRLTPDAAYCTPDIVAAVLRKRANLATHGSQASAQVRSMFEDLLDMASGYGEAMHVHGGAWAQAISTVLPEYDWTELVRVYDSPSKELPTGWRMRTLVQVLAAPIAANARFSPAAGLWGTWVDPDRQLSLIERVLFLPADVGTLSATRKAVSIDDAANASATARSLAANAQTSPWNNLDLLQTLSKLSEASGSISGASATDLNDRVQDLFERGVKTDPDVILIGLMQLEKPWNQLHNSLCSRLLTVFLTGHPNHQLVFYRLWQLDRKSVCAALLDFYEASPMNVTRILDITQELKALNEILDLRPFAFALDVASLANRREYILLSKWLGDQIDALGSPFVSATLSFLSEKIRHELQRQDAEPGSEAKMLALSIQTVATFLRTLREHHEAFSQEDFEAFKAVRTECLQLHPRLMDFTPGAEQEPGMAIGSFSADVEAEVDDAFKRMYDQEISVDSVIQSLQRAKESGSAHNKEFVACFLNGLFEEHRFFPSYPPQELTLTAHLFGSLIQHELLDYTPLGIAVRYVLDAIGKPADSAWCRFGIQALSRFSVRLPEWPQFTQAILNVPHLQQSHPEVASIALNALSRASAAEDGEVELPDDDDKDADVVFKSIKSPLADESDDARELPDEKTTDQILFIINNLSPSTVLSKVDDMVSKLQAPFFPWFAHYLVTQRVAIEPNNHGLYSDFLSGMRLGPLDKRIVSETIAKAAEVLNSQSTATCSQERALLKNLGGWLGNLTLAKNKPIRHDAIAFKTLLIEGHDADRLMVAIPFVCKVLEQSAKSRVFRPPNPWLMGILRLLVELYQFADLKLNLKFEIEVLCKALGVDLKELSPTTTLRDRPALTAGGEKGSAIVHDLERLSMTGFANQTIAQEHGGSEQAQSTVNGTQASYALSLQDTITAALQNLPGFVQINPQLLTLGSAPVLKRIVSIAIDRAVREIIAPVVERSVTIAGISTRELTTKDFAMEGDEDKMRSASHLMVQSLAGSLALVTCKEPLRISLVTHIRTLLIQNGFPEQNLTEQPVLVLAQDNLELACSVVEKVATEKAVSEIDDGLAPSLLARRKHRERSAQPFWDSAAMAASHYSGMLPDPLRLKLEGLAPAQLRVYEEFGRPRVMPSAAAETPDVRSRTAVAATRTAPATRDGVGSDSGLPVAPATPAEPTSLAAASMLPVQQTLDKFAHSMGEIDKLISAEGPIAFNQLPQDHDIFVVVSQIVLTAGRSSNRDETTLAYSQKVVQLLYRSETSLAREVYATLLERLCTVSVKAAREVTSWLVYADDERKFNVAVTVSLVKHRLVNVTDLDAALAKFITKDYRPSVINFTAAFVRECLFSAGNDGPLVGREQLAHSIEALDTAEKADKSTDNARELLDDLRNMASASAPTPSRSQLEEYELRDRLVICFVQWVSQYSSAPSVEKAFLEFVVQLQERGVLKGEEISSRFFRACAEASVDSYIKRKAAGGTIATGIFQPIDAFAKLVVLMIKYHADPQNVNNEQAKTHYLNKIMSIVVLVLSQSHEELGLHFQQKPFFRFLSTLLINLQAIEGHLGGAYLEILKQLCVSINTLQPAFFPGFAFSWVALISHRLFMPKLLQSKDSTCWAAWHRLMISHLRFMSPILQTQSLSESTRTLYSGTLRLFMVLLHDFPEYLAAYHFALIDSIPIGCTQLLNVVSSAYPASIRLPDPFLPSMKIDVIPEMANAPLVMSDYTLSLGQPLGKALETFAQSRSADELLGAIETNPSMLSIQASGAKEAAHNGQAIRSLVMYLAALALNQTKSQPDLVSFSSASPSVAVLKGLLATTDAEGRYLILSAAANQLRYPNCHTRWFAGFICNVFTDGSTAMSVKDCITRILLERVVVARPHPWGILVTIGILIRSCHLAELPFARCAPEVETLITQVDQALRVK